VQLLTTALRDSRSPIPEQARSLPSPLSHTTSHPPRFSSELVEDDARLSGLGGEGASSSSTPENVSLTTDDHITVNQNQLHPAGPATPALSASPFTILEPIEPQRATLRPAALFSRTIESMCLTPREIDHLFEMYVVLENVI